MNKEKTQTYTYLQLNPALFDQKEERKTIPMTEFENTWLFRLQTLQKYNDLMEQKVIVKGVDSTLVSKVQHRQVLGCGENYYECISKILIRFIMTQTFGKMSEA